MVGRISIVGKTTVGKGGGGCVGGGCVAGGCVGGADVFVGRTEVGATGVFVGTKRVGRTVGSVDVTTPVAVGGEKWVFVAVGSALVRGVNVLRTIGVMVLVRVIVGCGVSEVVGVGTVAVGNSTRNSNSDPGVSAATIKREMIRTMPINNADRNNGLSRSFLRRSIFTFAALLKRRLRISR
jgi:hypothetical protein